MARHEISALQYLRGMAATAVVIDHTNAMMEFPKYFGRNNGAFWNFGALGVSIFFVISGFIITLTSLENNDRWLRPKVSIRDFAIKRFSRIVPIMWLAVASYCLLRFLGRNDNFDYYAYVRAFFLIPYGEVKPDTIWTLRNEAIFYALFAISLLGKTARPWILLAWLASPLVYAALSLPEYPQTAGMQFLKVVTNQCNIEFGCGMLIGFAWLKWTRQRTFSAPFPSALLMLGLYIAFWVSGYALGLTADTLASTFVTALTGGMVVLFAIHLRCTTGLLERVALYLGEASFSIYLFHLHIVSAVLGIWAKLAHTTPAPIVVTGTTLIALAGTIVIFELVERPIHRITYKWMQGTFQNRPASA